MLDIQLTVWKFLINYGIGLRRGRDNCFNRLEYLKNHEQEGGPWNVTTEENDLGSPRIWRGMSQKALLGHRTEHIRDKPYGLHQCGRCLSIRRSPKAYKNTHLWKAFFRATCVTSPSVALRFSRDTREGIQGWSLSSASIERSPSVALMYFNCIQELIQERCHLFAGSVA